MADVHEPQTRSYNMSQIRGKDTKPEMLVRKFLHNRGFRYRLHDKNLPGKPDLVFNKIKTVIFIHGCFWHGHENCKYFKLPKSKTEWWQNKIKGNKMNDRENYERLISLGWKILTIWECELKPKVRERTLTNIYNNLQNLFIAK